MGRKMSKFLVLEQVNSILVFFHEYLYVIGLYGAIWIASKSNLLYFFLHKIYLTKFMFTEDFFQAAESYELIVLTLFFTKNTFFAQTTDKTQM